MRVVERDVLLAMLAVSAGSADGWARLTAASGESASAEIARSPIDTIPTTCPSLMTIE